MIVPEARRHLTAGPRAGRAAARGRHHHPCSHAVVPMPMLCWIAAGVSWPAARRCCLRSGRWTWRCPGTATVRSSRRSAQGPDPAGRVQRQGHRALRPGDDGPGHPGPSPGDVPGGGVAGPDLPGLFRSGLPWPRPADPAMWKIGTAQHPGPDGYRAVRARAELGDGLRSYGRQRFPMRLVR